MNRHSSDPVDGIVVRATRYRDHDVVLRVVTRQRGAIGVVARQARRSRSRVAPLIEPGAVVRLELARGRGDLHSLRGVPVRLRRDSILRSNWKAQSTAAVALDMLSRLAGEESSHDELYHVTVRWLDELERVVSTTERDDGDVVTLLLAWQLKALLAIGIAPELRACVRCGAIDNLGGWSTEDGGLVCSEHRKPGDVVAPAAAVELGRTLTASSLAECLEATSGHHNRSEAAEWLRRVVVGGLCRSHAGFSPRSPQVSTWKRDIT